MIDVSSFYSIAFLSGSMLVALAGVATHRMPRNLRWWRLLLPVIIVLMVATQVGALIAQAGGLRDMVGELSDRLVQLQVSLSPALAAGLDKLLARLRSVASGDELPLALVLTTAFIWLYLLVRLSLVIVLGMIGLMGALWRGLKRLIVRLRTGAWPIQHAYYPRTLPDRAGFLVPAARWTLLALVLWLAAIPWLAERLPIVDYLTTLFWAGSWVAMIEVAVWLRGETQQAGQFSGDQQRPERVDLLEELYREYQRRHAGQILLACKEPAHTTAQRPHRFDDNLRDQHAAVRRRYQAVYPPVAIDSLLRVWEHIVKGHDVLLPETLCASHFGLFAEGIEHHLRVGRSTVLLCPNGAEADIRRALYDQMATHHARLTRSLHIMGEAIGVDQRIDVMICPASRFAALVSEMIAHTLDLNPGLLVAIDSQSLPLAQLRGELIRLRQQPMGGEVQFIVQCEHYRDAEPAMREVIPFNDLHEERLNPVTMAERYLLLWDAGPVCRKDLQAWYAAGYRGYIDPALLLCILPVERGFPVAYLDAGRRLDHDLTERMSSHLNVFHINGATRPEGWLRLETSAMNYAVSDSVVMVLEDRQNMVLALYRNYGFIADRPTLINVIGHNYLLRDYMVARFCGDRQQQLYRLSEESLLARMPRARGGLMDLARTLRWAASQAHGITEDELRHFLGCDGFPLPGLLHELAITASYQGLARLFRAAWGDDAGLRRNRLREGDRYTCTGFGPLGPAFREVRTAMGSLGLMNTGDYGLVYMEGTYLMFGGKFHRVTGVNDRDNAIKVAHQDDDTCKRYRYFFDRSYKITACEHDTALESWQEGAQTQHVHAGGVTLTLTHQHRHFTRTTYGYARVAETMRPFDSAATDDDRDVVYQPAADTPTVPRRWQNVLLFTFTGSRMEGLEPQDRVRLAATLCALLQECVYSLFPSQSANLAVVSPQAGARDADLLRQGMTPETLPRVMYPHMDAVPGDVEAQMDIFVFEDADTDLGVVRSIKDDHDQFLEVVLDFLTWTHGHESVEHFHAFGADRLPAYFDYDAVRSLLAELYPGKTVPVTAIPEPVVASEVIPREQECDFCGATLRGQHFRLSDGRWQCQPCQGSAVNDLEEFRSLLAFVRAAMSRRYRIRLRGDIHVRFASAHEIAARAGEAYTPTERFDPRTVGLAVRRQGGRSEVLVENGAPRISVLAITAHELTHIWQFDTLGGNELNEELAEGQARYIEIDFVRANGGEELARLLEAQARVGDDIYARGWRRVNGACCVEPGGVFRCFEKMLAAQ